MESGCYTVTCNREGIITIKTDRTSWLLISYQYQVSSPHLGGILYNIYTPVMPRPYEGASKWSHGDPFRSKMYGGQSELQD